MVFRQSTEDIISVVIHIEGREGWLQAFKFVVRCDTLLAYADAAARVVAVPTAGVADAESSNGDGDGRSASAQAQVVVGDGDVNAVGGVPWTACGPQATALSDQMHVGWRYLGDEGCPWRTRKQSARTSELSDGSAKEKTP
jgi:hypothetical protein